MFICVIFDISFAFDKNTSNGINKTLIKEIKIEKIKTRFDKGESSSEST